MGPSRAENSPQVEWGGDCEPPPPLPMSPSEDKLENFRFCGVVWGSSQSPGLWQAAALRAQSAEGMSADRDSGARGGRWGKGRALSPLSLELGLEVPAGWPPLRQHLGSSLSEARAYPVIVSEQKYKENSEAGAIPGGRGPAAESARLLRVRIPRAGGARHLGAPLGAKGRELTRAEPGDRAEPRGA